MRQIETSECGLICLAIAAKILGAEFDVQALRNKYNVSSRGLSLKQVKEIAADMGMLGRAIRCEVEELKSLKTPTVLHWGMHHFVVLRKVTGRRFLIDDPVFGEKLLTAKEISDKFSGVALELTPTLDFKKRKEPSPLSLGSWFQIMPVLHGSLLQIFIMSVLLQAYVIAAPFYMQLVVDQGALKGDREVLVALAVGFGLLSLFNSGATFFRGIVTARLTALLNWDMTLRLFRHMIRLPLPWFQRRRLADILSRFDSIGPVRDLMSGALVTTIVDGALALVTLVMMVIFSRSLAVVAILGFCVTVIVKLCSLPVNLRIGSSSITARIAEQGKRIESIRAIQTIKSMGAESAREGDWANKFAKVIHFEQRVSLVKLSFSSIQGLIDSILKVAIVYLGGKSIIDGEFSVGLLYAFLTYQGQFSERGLSLFEQYLSWKMTDMYSYRLADIVLTSKEEGIDEIGSALEQIRGGIEFKNVSFTYSNLEKNIFSSISFKILPGEFVAIVGPSGVGKSTLLKVLCGLYSASSGEVFIDEKSINSYGIAFVRRSLGIVMQDDELLYGTIAENVAFFDEQIDIARVWDCLQKAALASDVDRFPQKIHTLVGDMGSNISGGQKQRLLLARALYKRPRILVLDEATSHLDAAREHQINSCLRELNITRVIVAHRAETIAAADRVITLSNTGIVSDKFTRRNISLSTPIAIDSNELSST